MEALPALFRHDLSYVGLFGVIFATGVGLPLPEDVVVLGAGYLVYRGTTALVPTVVVTLAGVLAGDLFLYGLGRRLGRRLLEHPRLARRFPPARIARAERFFERWGLGAVVVARFVAGVRAAVYVTAGALRMGLGRFLLVDLCAAIVNVPLLVLLGRFAGPEVETLAAAVMGARLAATLALIFLAALALAWRRLRRRGR